ncbi:MAG: hypothetical protein ACR2LL_01825 [Nitrosopumilus sp.]|nr:hypothetical protein [Nitrosopumilus sp.]
MSSNNNNFPEDKRKANWAVKIVTISIAAGIALSFLIGFIINGGWK